MNGPGLRGVRYFFFLKDLRQLNGAENQVSEKNRHLILFPWASQLFPTTRY